jgi:hypothetical protein
MPEPVFMKDGYLYHGTCAHLNGVFHKSLPLYVCMFIPPRQWLGKHVPAATNTRDNGIIVGLKCL